MRRNGLRKCLLQRRVAGRGIRCEEIREVDADATALRDLRAACADGRDRRAAQGVIARTDVDGERDILRNHVDRAREHRHLADRADEARVRFAVVLDEEHHLARRRQRVLAPAHRHCPCMAREPGDAYVEPRRAGNGGDDADRESLVQQDGTLLDVRFDVGDDIFSAPVDVAPAIGVAAEGRDRLPHRDAIVVGLVEPRRVELAGHGLAADQRRAEAHAFLVAEADDLERVGQPDVAVVEILDARDCGDDAEQAVVLTGIAHAVLVGSGHDDRRIRVGGFVAADDIAERVEIGVHAGTAHQAKQKVAGLLVLVAEIGARDARRVLGELREHVGLAEEFGSESHGVRWWRDSTSVS